MLVIFFILSCFKLMQDNREAKVALNSNTGNRFKNEKIDSESVKQIMLRNLSFFPKNFMENYMIID